jgi:hypothetical protein
VFPGQVQGSYKFSYVKREGIKNGDPPQHKLVMDRKPRLNNLRCNTLLEKKNLENKWSRKKLN